MRNWLFAGAVGLLALAQRLPAQTTFPVQGIPDPRSGHYIFINGKILADPSGTATVSRMVIRDGRIEAVGDEIPVPAGAVTVDLQGRHVYPAFIDLYSDYGMPRPSGQAESGGRRRGGEESWVSERPGAWGWNEALRSDHRAADHFQPDDKSAEALRKAGFGAVATHTMDGISRGTSAVVTLGAEHAQKELLRSDAAHHLSFRKGSSRTSFPGSLMGCVALLRQTYLDGRWYAQNRPETNLSLEAWNAVQALPQVFDARDWQEVLRAQAIAGEFGLRYIYKGAGDEYRRVDALKATGSTFILPLNFPEPFQVDGPYDAQQVALQDMKHWEWAPANAAVLERAGIPFVLTAHGLKKTEQFLPALRKAVEHGLSRKAALEAITIGPARLAGVEQELGSLAKGKRANFLIASGSPFDAETVFYENWINGKPHVLQSAQEPDLDGKYDLSAGTRRWNLEVRGGARRNEFEVLVDTLRSGVKASWDQGRIHLTFRSPDDSTGQYMLSGIIGKEGWTGRGTGPDGLWLDWKATYRDTVQGRPDRERRSKPADTGSFSAITQPFLPFGWKERPKAQTWLIKNATLWTNESDGILRTADILLQDGKIKRIGRNLSAEGATVIDAKGKHVTPGIIDEHSHIAISRGVNECTQENTAEVRIGDVINSEDINIYRQLSGGVTTAQLLHGSCNPIGGQSAIIKLRWGATPEEMKFQGAPGFIKFALGENVKRGNSSSNSRYPNTRMGVEQVYVNAFTRAREYERAKKDPAARVKLRPDLEMETVLEILNSQRFITCHSYVQSEINMLMKVAEGFGFRVNTFTHILEGYKVADKMAKHGAGASSFSDWWAYKFEVYEAIPHNGALLHGEGVVTAFNSDDAEMARRLNQEAGKAVLYGNVPEEDALKFVTLNPARLLRIDHRVGSLKVGKDADIVIWSDHPLSVYAVAEATFVDGIRYFDRATDLQLREEVRAERQRLLARMRTEGGGRGRPVSPAVEMHYHCDTVHDEIID